MTHSQVNPRMSLCEVVLEHVREHPGQTRSQIVAAVNLSPKQVSNALKIMRERGKLECQFVGRFSTWSPPRELGRQTPAVNSVWGLGA